MALTAFPFESKRPFLSRTWQAALRPLLAPRSVWDEIYRGDSLLAPLGFTYLWVLAALPLVLAGPALGTAALRRVMGPESRMVLAQVLMTAPGLLIVFLLWPLLMGFLGGCLGHGLLRILDREARLRGTLRAFGYACAWSIPWTAAGLAGGLYVLCNPLAAVRMEPGPAPWPAQHPSAGLLVLGIFQFLASLATLALTTWALASLHRSAWWKALLAALLGLAGAGIAGEILAPVADHAFVSAVIGLRERQERKAQDPRARIRLLVERVEHLQAATASSFRKAGLPEPPRAVDLLTGGDWSAAIDLHQAVQSGFPPSCQRIYDLTLGALQGQVIFLSDCLGQGRPVQAYPLPAPLMPPGSEAAAQRIRLNLTGPQRESLAQALTAYRDTLLWVQSALGPFQAQAAPRTEPVPPAQASPAPGPEASPDAHPGPSDLPSAPISERVSLADLRALAAQESPAAMNELGRKYFFGQDVRGLEPVARDRAEGLKWMAKAYDAGFRSVESCTCLMASYATGQGVPMDRAFSEVWRSRADAIRDAERRKN